MLDLFQPPKVRAKPTRSVQLLGNDPPLRLSRWFVGPRLPRKPYVRTPEQNRRKNQRYAERVGRDVINARERARYWRVKHESR